ncbi:GDSL esterase/lipase LTL1-like [Bidens hawaiensis]|uniref:GDSL esterase/lipase LTL1-like n=1 Tax=Bidens hawaiensis TaxID=980011 RepID=UPI004049076B
MSKLVITDHATSYTNTIGPNSALRFRQSELLIPCLIRSMHCTYCIADFRLEFNMKINQLARAEMARIPPVNIIRAPVQLDYFKQYQGRISALIGPKRTRQLVNNVLVLMTLGGNDFVNNYYFVPYYVLSRQYILQDFVPFIVSEYKKLLLRLYYLGARRVLVTGIGSQGCVPAELAQHSRNGECEPELQRAVSLFNSQLDDMLIGLNKELGFVIVKIACCGQGPYNGIGVCSPLSKICLNRYVYAFWDTFHPSEKANRLIVD